MPDVSGIAPSYEEKSFGDDDTRGRLRLVASNDAREGSVLIHADAALYAGRFDGDEAATHRVADGRLAYVHVARGSIVVDGTTLVAGDALKVVAPCHLSIEAGHASEVLLFDLAA